MQQSTADPVVTDTLARVHAVLDGVDAALLSAARRKAPSDRVRLTGELLTALDAAERDAAYLRNRAFWTALDRFRPDELQPCAYPGCPKKVRYGFCSDHTGERSRIRRQANRGGTTPPPPSKRGAAYGWRQDALKVTGMSVSLWERLKDEREEEGSRPLDLPADATEAACWAIVREAHAAVTEIQKRVNVRVREVRNSYLEEMYPTEPSDKALAALAGLGSPQSVYYLRRAWKARQQQSTT